MVVVAEFVAKAMGGGGCKGSEKWAVREQGEDEEGASFPRKERIRWVPPCSRVFLLLPTFV